MEPIFFVPLALGILLVIALLLVYSYALKGRGEEPRIYPDTDFSNPAGFRVVSLPGDETLTRGRNLLREGRLAELEFTADPGRPFFLRICPTGGSLGLDGLNTAFEQRSVFQLEGTRVVLLQTPGGPALALWQRGGFDYALWFEETEMGLIGGLVDDFVTQTVTVKS